MRLTSAPVAARFAVAGLVLAGWAASGSAAGADPDSTPSPAPSASASPTPSPAASGSPAPSASPSPAPSASPSPAASGSPAPSGAPGSGPKTTIDKDGTYAVGSDIAPGTYTSAGPVGNNGTCYWKRTSNPDGALIDNNMSKKPQVVQIDPADKAFKTDGCQPWQLNPDATPPPSSAPAGVGPALSILNGLLAPNGQQAPHN